ncbi:ATM1-type heavy metal exporter [wastewater metagenome]|uniref:ATM1-type heavy metal exporter n=2 Tax=unclassified sequences TaxID=12908 RepID=A0A5B8R8W9_9ZZZZ|nr:MULTISPECIES: ABC transporter ATP-binding protein/permease [Arhodomonas]MCS4502570.1 ABC transporter ATP-binding protein/permease [Arhodomonas aquaeolei]QEA04398.1 ATM1-type heavy metal exporter [uncultured organism]
MRPVWHHPRTESPSGRTDAGNLWRMLGYLRPWRGRVALALAALIGAKLAVVGVPLLLKRVVDALDTGGSAMFVTALGLLGAYGALRLANSGFSELRDALFARVRYAAMHRLSTTVLRHLHELSLGYHLERRTGAVSRDLARGTRSVSSILNYLVLNLVPTLAETLLVVGILIWHYSWTFSATTAAAIAVYIAFTLSVTEWRMSHRHRMNALESRANDRAVDSLLNYETVKYFNNEPHELRAYDRTLDEWTDAAVRTQVSMGVLNFGQGAIIAVAVTAIMVQAALGVSAGAMSLGDLVMVNGLLLQLFMPLNVLGSIYRAMKYALADMDLVFRLLDTPAGVTDRPDAQPLMVREGCVRFEGVAFGYRPERRVVEDIDFTIGPGRKVAVVGPSGAGKSTLARLLFRFWDPDEGRITIDGQDLRECTQDSVRTAIGIVPQDTVLFNDTIAYNIGYGAPAAGRAEIERAARLADIHDFIVTLPDGYDTVVGERGLKLSGGEKQRVAIARVILKQPPILVFDEATSSLDSRSEGAILGALDEVARGVTTLVIAHRLSTVADADEILVMEHGRIRERGSHAALLARDGLYAHLWRLQQAESEAETGEATAAR